MRSEQRKRRRWPLLLAIALTLPAALAQPSDQPIPVPEYLGFQLVGPQGELIELTPRVEDELGFLNRIDQVEDLQQRLNVLGVPTAGANPRLIVYQPGVDFDEMLFLFLPLGGGEERQLFPRVRPSQQVDGLYEMTLREPLEMGLLIIFRMLGEWGEESVRAVLICPEGQSLTQIQQAVDQRRVDAYPDRVRSDLRSLAVALECYMIDWNIYPPCAPAGDPSSVNAHDNLMSQMPAFGGPSLTTPIAYLTGLSNDPFATTGDATYAYVLFDDSSPQQRALFGEWLMLSPGPDRDWDLAPWPVTEDQVRGSLFDVTNGTMSSGDIVRTQRPEQW